MSTRFYAGQQDYIIQLNLIDDEFNATVASVSGKADSNNGVHTGTTTVANLFLNRVAGAAKGIQWYNTADNTWQEYMAVGGSTLQGPRGTITAPTGTLVTDWALRSVINTSAGMGWTFETNTPTGTTPTIVAEINTAGAARFASTVTAPSFAGTATNSTNSAITNDTSTNATMYPTWVTGTSGNLPHKVSSTKLTFNPSTGTLSSTTFSGALSGTATNATNTGVTDDVATATTVYPTWVTGTSGNLPQKVSSSTFSFIPSTGALTLGGTGTTKITLNRTGSAINTTIGFQNTSGTLYAGHGAANTWAVGGAADLTASPWMTVAATAATIAGSLTVGGNLTVNGTTTTVNSTTVTLDDPVLTLGGDTAPTVDDNTDRGIEYRWHTGAAAKLGFFGFDDSQTKFIFIPDATNTAGVYSGATGTIAANLEGNVTGDVTGNVSGTAANVTGVVAVVNGGTGVTTSTGTGNNVLSASPALTGNPTAPTASTGDNDTSISTTAFVQTAVNGYATLSVAGATASYTLTAAQYGISTLELTGARTANVDIVLPTTAQKIIIKNSTTGAYTTTVKLAAGGASVTVPVGQSRQLYSSGTNVYGVDYLTDFWTGAVDANNNNLNNVNALTFADPGPNEGISWTGGNFAIWESPDDLTSQTAGNVQFVSGGVSQMTVQTDGKVRANSGFLAGTHSVSLPAYSFVADPDTGIYNGGTNAIHFATGGSVAAYIDASNNLRVYGGIGVGGAAPSTTAVIANSRTVTGDSNNLLINGTLTVNDATLTAARTYYGGDQVVSVGVNTLNGFSWDAYGWRARTYVGTADDVVATADVACGLYGQATNRSTGTTNATYGAQHYAQNTRAGAITTSMYATYNKVDIDEGTVTTAYGTYNHIELDAGTLTGMIGVYNRLDRDAGTVAGTTYGMYNSFEGTLNKKVGVFNNGQAIDLDLASHSNYPLTIGHYDNGAGTVYARLTFATTGVATFSNSVNIPTEAVGDSSTKAASTAFAQQAAADAAIVYAIVFG